MKFLGPLLVLLAIGCSKKQTTRVLLDQIQTDLIIATDIHDYEDNYVSTRSEELLEIYEENPDDVCLVLNSLDSDELINYREVFEEVQSEIRCANYAVRKIENYYSQHFSQNLWTPQKDPKSSIASKVEILDQPLSMPKQSQLPNKVVNLTFDDGPHASLTEKLLDTLDNYNVKVNFFVVGSNVRAYPHLLKKSAERGHSIGGHSMTHSDLAAKNFESAKAEINGVMNLIGSVLGGYDPYFRFPFGSRTRTLRNYLVQTNIADFFWNIDTLDWKHKNPDSLLRYAIDQTAKTGRGVVLFHDIQPQTIAIMPQYLKYLEHAGFQTIVYYPK